MNKAYRKPKIYEHKNGYSAKLYGKSSLSIYFKGKEVAHTGSRNVNTEEEVMELLRRYPNLMKIIQKWKEGALDE